ncbi:MAG: ATP-binding protein, partial [Myxococcota bacterium]
MDRYVSDTERVARGSEPEVVIEPATSPATGERKVFRSVKAPARDKEGRSLVVIVAQDISDLELARERLADREAVLQATLQAVASGTWEFEPLTGSLRNDQAWMEIFGVKPEDHDGTVGTFARLLHPEDQASVMARVNACLHDGVQGYVSEHRMLHADGHVIWVRDSGVVVNRDPDGNALRMVGAVVDITELKTQQAELERRRREAEAAVHAKSRFLANMSHELRTPMNGVLGMLDHLLDTELGAEQRDLARIARTSAEGLLAILNDILDTSKLEAGGVELEAVCVDLDGLLDEVEGMFGNQAREKGLGLRLQRGSSTPRCAMGDPTRLRQVLVNLLGNALKFTSEGFVDLDLEGREGRLEVHVRDTGPGISEEAQARLFERFTQADVSTTRKFGGSGLGLAITRQLVELMGGEIEVNSAVGEGSCFTLRLPLVAASEESLDTAAVPPASVDLPPLRVLLADDVPVNRMVVGRLLERLGHEVVSVENGRQAVEAVTGEAFAWGRDHHGQCGVTSGGGAADDDVVRV